MIVWTIEITDTFGDEANYCWVNRYTMKLPSKLSDAQVMRKARKVAGFHGKARRIDNYGDGFALWNPDGACIVMFITFHDTEEYAVKRKSDGFYIADKHHLSTYTEHLNRAHRYETIEDAQSVVNLVVGAPHEVVKL